MAEDLLLEVVTPEREVVREHVSEVQVPANTGYLGVLPGHTPLLTELGIGALSYKTAGETRFVAVIGGFAEVLPDRVTVLANSAERAEEIDVVAARANLEAAEKAATPGPDAATTDWDAKQRYVTAAKTRLEVAEHSGRLITGAAH